MKVPTRLDAIDQSFEWSRVARYRWRGNLLVYDILEPHSSYFPLRDHPALFLELAKTPPTKAGVVSFAKRFGALGGARPDMEELAGFFIGGQELRRLRQLRRSPRERVGTVLSRLLREAGERLVREPQFAKAGTLRGWRDAISRMRQAVELWRTLQRRTVGANEVDTWIDRLGVIEVADKNMFSKGARETRSREILQATLRRMLNHGMELSPIRAVLRPTPNGDFQLVFQPLNLLAALWLQFAQAVAGNYAIRICRGCGKPFPCGAGTNRRADATTCNDSCRQSAHRKDKAAESHPPQNETNPRA